MKISNFRLIQDIVVKNSVIEKRFSCDLTSCKGACCVVGDYGAPITREEVFKIKSAIPKIMDQFPETDRKILQNGRWYIQNRFGETSLVDGKTKPGCIFIQVEKSTGINQCSLHKLALTEKVPVSTYKPQWCHLYPLILRPGQQKVLDFSDREECVNGQKGPILSEFSSALEERLGAPFNQELQKILNSDPLKSE